MAEIAAVAVLNNPVVADPSKDKEVKALKAFSWNTLHLPGLKSWQT